MPQKRLEKFSDSERGPKGGTNSPNSPNPPDFTISGVSRLNPTPLPKVTTEIVNPTESAQIVAQTVKPGLKIVPK